MSRDPATRALTLAPLLAAYLFGTVFLVLLLDCRFIPGDEGVATMGAWRILEGQVPHRDFFEIVPPFSFLPTAAAFELLGTGFRAERLLVLAYGILLMLGVERLVARFTRDVLVRCMVVVFLIPFGVAAWSIPSHHWVVDLLQIGALLSLLAGLRGGRPLAWGAAAGVLTGLGCFTLQDQGAYLVVALAALFFPWIADPARRRRLVVGWAAAGLAVTGLFALWLLPHVSVGELLHQWVGHPISSYKTLPGNRGSLAATLAGLGSQGWLERVAASPAYHLGLSGLTAVLLVLPLVSAAILVWAAVRRWRPPAEVGLLAAGWAAFLGACLHRYAVVNLIWAAPVPLAVLAWGLARSRESGERRKSLLATIVAVAVLGSGAAYSWAILGLVSGPAMVEIRGPAGTLRTIAGSPEAAIGPVIEAVERHVPPGTPLFCTRFNALVNFWTLRPNPTRFNFLVQPAYHTREQAEEAIGDLRRRPDAYVLLFYPLLPGDLVAEHVLRHYRPVWRGLTALLMAPARDPLG